MDTFPFTIAREYLGIKLTNTVKGLHNGSFTPPSQGILKKTLENGKVIENRQADL